MDEIFSDKENLEYEIKKAELHTEIYKLEAQLNQLYESACEKYKNRLIAEYEETFNGK